MALSRPGSVRSAAIPPGPRGRPPPTNDDDSMGELENCSGQGARRNCTSRHELSSALLLKKPFRSHVDVTGTGASDTSF